MRKKTVLFILVSLIIAFAPLTNWQVDENITKGVVWRLTMLTTFAIGYFFNTDVEANIKARRQRRINRRLTRNS